MPDYVYSKYGSLLTSSEIKTALVDARRNLKEFNKWDVKNKNRNEFWERHISPLARKQIEIERKFSKRKFGIFGKKELTPEAQIKVGEISGLISSWEKENDSKYPPQKSFPYPNGRKFYSDYQRIVSCLETRLAESGFVDEKQSKTQRKMAKVAAATGKTREQANTVKARLPKNHACPYCGNTLGGNPHADHIYPVSKGGQSFRENMVYVCRGCNVKKGILTLSHFINKPPFPKLTRYFMRRRHDSAIRINAVHT